jgi:hypothetical protein
MGGDESRSRPPQLVDQIDRLNIWCRSVLPDIRSIETDFQTGANLIRLLQTLRPGTKPRSSYKIERKPNESQIQRQRDVALAYVKDLGVPGSWERKSLSTIEELVNLLSTIALALGSETDLSILAKPLRGPSGPPTPPAPAPELPKAAGPVVAAPAQKGGPAPNADPIAASVVRLSNFEEMQKIGEGSFSEVYSARDPRTGMTVAVKKLKRAMLGPKELESFDREVKILASVDHPTLLKFCGFVPVVNADGDPPSIITAFASRGSLRDLIKMEQRKEHPTIWDLTQKYIVLYGIAVGMMELHRQRIIHRDLKAENVLLDDNYEAKVGDFGLSKFVSADASMQ